MNAGDFDPLSAMADLAERHGAWFHVDGAFGLFAAVCRGRGSWWKGSSARTR